MEDKKLSEENADAPISATPSRIVTEDKYLHLVKADSPMVSREAGRLMELIEVESKALSPMVFS